MYLVCVASSPGGTDQMARIWQSTIMKGAVGLTSACIAFVAGALISLEEKNDSPNAIVHLFASDPDKLAEAQQTIKGVTGADLLVSS